MRIIKLSLCIFTVALTSFAIFFESPAPVDKELSRLEEVAGANFCASGTVKNFDSIVEETDESIGLNSLHESKNISPEIGYREKVVKIFDSTKYPCLSFEDWDKDITFKERSSYLRKNSGYIIVDGFRTSLIVTSSRKYENIIDADLIFVRIPGGPGGTSIISNFDDLVDYESGAITIDFFYRGNGFNLNYPESSFYSAIYGLKAYLKYLRKRNNNARIILVGESLGSSLSASVLRELSSEKSKVVDKAILLSPPFGSLNQTADRLVYLYRGLSKNERYALYRLRNKGRNGSDYGQLIYLDWVDVFRTFYTEKEGGYMLYDWLKQVPVTPVLVIYGNQDDRISHEKSERFFTQRLENVDLFIVDGMRHQFNRFSEAADIRAEIDAFLN